MGLREANATEPVLRFAIMLTLKLALNGLELVKIRIRIRIKIRIRKAGRGLPLPASA